jgi:predicted DNA-binding transcriptional regulator YafY
MARAVWNETRLHIRYESWKGIVERTIDPLGLVLKASEWYAVARVGRDLRTYRLSNVLAVAVADGGERFVRPRGFDLPRHWAESIERFEAGLYRGTAELRVSERGLVRLKSLSAAVAAAAGRAGPERDRDGRVRVTIPIESTEQAARDLLVLGAEGEVLGPPELRAALGDTSRAMARLYTPPPRRRNRRF